MYPDPIPENLFTITPVNIIYDCCGKIHILKWRDANANFQKNGGKHICRSCGLRSNNPGARPEVKAKIKKTVDERYGGVLPVNSEANIAARVESMFGTPEAIHDIVEKRKKTSMERYGADHIMKTPEGIARLNEAMQERYGVDFPMQSDEVQERTRQTCQKRYGVDNPLSSPEIQDKVRKTMMELYGVEHYNQLPEMKEYLRNNCTIWLAESYANPWSKGTVRPVEWNTKQRMTVRKLIAEGNWLGGFVSNFKGKFPAWKCKKINPRFLSMLEAKFHLFLNLNAQVEWYDYEGLIIEYKKLDGTNHDYYVDFQVKYFNDEILHNYELKAWQNRDKFDTQAKYDAAVVYCDQHNMFYEILFETDVEKLGIPNEVVKNFPGIVQY